MQRSVKFRSGILSTCKTASGFLISDMGSKTYNIDCMEYMRGVSDKFFDLASAYDEVPDSLREHYRSLGATAEACVACHACEGRCPFGVRVAERMEAAAELFGC